MQNVFGTLKKDHEKQRDLLKKLKATSGDSPERATLFKELKEELDNHAVAEERAVYSFMLADELTQEKAGHSIHEHKEIDHLVADLGEMELSNPNWIRKLQVLSDKVNHHLDEEEEIVFPLGNKILDAQEKAEMAKDFKFVKRQEES
ncbi:MAG: hemerythrin domain-containing protein [Candidatus Eisenbacteria bacterium]|uniref:Hemerythrin domain-containing protein n=1 Tax=Eiseniibacteriota bacterium TaxID=2212470 RepID=A0A7Y2EEU8_UNCEI|nr:hemerythrin domain-containing protein [Candidatus Eisenbacteria bacterium]